MTGWKLLEWYEQTLICPRCDGRMMRDHADDQVWCDCGVRAVHFYGLNWALTRDFGHEATLQKGIYLGRRNKP
jgi:ribosomal protein S27AE